MVTKQLKSKLEMINSKRTPSRRITWEGVTRLDADLPSGIPHSTRNQAVRLFHKAARAKEEEFRIHSEMRNTIQHYLCKLEVITAALVDLEQCSELTTYQSGTRSLLHSRKVQCYQALARLNTFARHGDFPELSQYLPGDQHDTDTYSGESRVVPEEDPKSESNMLDGCGTDDEEPQSQSELVCTEDLKLDSNVHQDQFETYYDMESDVGEPTVNSETEGSDSDNFFDGSDEEDYNQLPVHRSQQLPMLPQLHQSSFESKASTGSSSSLNTTSSSISVHYKDYRAPISTLSDTGAKPFDDNDAPKSNDTSSGSDEEEMEVQHWRKEKFLCEEYIRSTMVGYR